MKIAFLIGTAHVVMLHQWWSAGPGTKDCAILSLNVMRTSPEAGTLQARRHSPEKPRTRQPSVRELAARTPSAELWTVRSREPKRFSAQLSSRFLLQKVSGLGC